VYTALSSSYNYFYALKNENCPTLSAKYLFTDLLKNLQMIQEVLDVCPDLENQSFDLSWFYALQINKSYQKFSCNINLGTLNFSSF
jgi:hypothetical protein